MSEINEILTPILLMFIAGCFIGIFLIARWIYFDAKSRGMNPWPWVLLTAILSPNFIGLLIYVLVRANNEKSMKCRSCNTKIPVSAKFCPNCGAKIDAENQITTQPADNRSLIAGIVLLLLFIMAVIAGISVSSAVKSGSGSYARQEVSYNLGNTWKSSFKTLKGEKTGFQPLHRRDNNETIFGDE